jgi:hypothetical protein
MILMKIKGEALFQFSAFPATYEISEEYSVSIFRVEEYFSTKIFMNISTFTSWLKSYFQNGFEGMRYLQLQVTRPLCCFKDGNITLLQKEVMIRQTE